MGGVVVVNPGPLSKRKGAGTYARVTVYPRKLADDERQAEASDGIPVGHELYRRARVDIVKI